MRLQPLPWVTALMVVHRVRLATSVHRMLELRESLFNGIARAQCQNAATRFLVRFDQLAPRRAHAFANARHSRGNHHAA
jgi:hypothetical protein